MLRVKLGSPEVKQDVVSALLGILRRACRVLEEVICCLSPVTCHLSPVGAQKEARLLPPLIPDPKPRMSLGQMESWPLVSHKGLSWGLERWLGTDFSQKMGLQFLAVKGSYAGMQTYMKTNPYT